MLASSDAQNKIKGGRRQDDRDHFLIEDGDIR